MIRVHYHHQQWLKDAEWRRWQRFHFFRPMFGPGIGVTVWCHEFSVSFPVGEAS